MEKLDVVPDVLDKLPGSVLQVKYQDHNVGGGNELTPTQVKSPPKVSWNGEQGQFYTLCMTDPDAPSRSNPKQREWHHWLVVNIPGEAIEKGEVLTQYVGAGPPKGSGLHRYVLVVYKQPNGKQSFSGVKKFTNRTGTGRGKFSIRTFAKTQNLGDPVAVNMFQAQWDSYVPKLYEQLKG